MPQKKIVIKFNYSTAAANHFDGHDNFPKIHTEWNYKRIIGALAVLLLACFVTYKFWIWNVAADNDISESQEFAAA